MLKLTKPEKETVYIKVLRVLLSVCFLMVPLVFFTNLTEEPFVVQKALLYTMLAGIYGTLAVKFLRSKTINFTNTFFDLAFFVYVLVCVVSWLSAVSSAPQALRQTMFYGLLEYGSLLWVAALGAYVISKNIVFSGVIENKSNYILLFIAWGALWMLLPFVKTTLSADNLFARMFDWYGLLLWAAGVYLGVRVLKKLTQENILLLAFIACFLACIYGVLQAVGLEFLWPFEINQFATKTFSTFGNPNFLSSMVVMLFPALLVYFMRASRRKDWLVYGLFVLVYVLFLSFGAARSSWIGTLCALIMMWMFGTLRTLIWSKKGRVFVLAILAVGAGYAAVHFGGAEDKNPVARRAAELAKVTPASVTLNVSPEEIFPSLHQRLFMWDVSKEIFLSRPVLGAGLGNFEAAFVQNQPKTLLNYPNLRELKAFTSAPHNELFFQLAQGGIVGLGMFLFMFMVLFLEVRDFASHKKEGDKKQLLQALFCGILGMLADNMFNISLHVVVPAFIFWWMIGAEVSGVGKEERTVEIAANPATKTVALCVLFACVLLVLWQALAMNSHYRSFEGDKYMSAALAASQAGDKELAAQRETAAREQYSRAFSMYPGNTGAGYKWGSVLLKNGQYSAALAAFEKTMAAASHREEVYFRAALAAQAAGDEKKAARYLQEHIRLHPYHLESYLLLAQLLRKNVIYADNAALTLLERGVTLFPYETELWTLLGEIYLKREEPEYAKNIFTRALTIDTLSKSVHRHLSKLCAKDEEKPSVLEQSARLQQYQTKMQNFAALSRSAQKRLRTDLEAYVAEYPQDDNGPILLARWFALWGNDIKSKELLEAVLAKNPDNVWAATALSTLLFQAEDLSGARRHLEKALFYYPENKVVLRRLKALDSVSGAN